MIHNHQEEYYGAINHSNADGESTAFISFMLSMIRQALEETVAALSSEGTKSERRWNTIESFLSRRAYIQSRAAPKGSSGELLGLQAALKMKAGKEIMIGHRTLTLNIIICEEL